MVKMIIFIIISVSLLLQIIYYYSLIIYDLLVLLFLKYWELAESTRAILSSKNKHKSHSPVFKMHRNRRNGGGPKGPRQPCQAQWLRAVGWLQVLLQYKELPYPSGSLGGKAFAYYWKCPLQDQMTVRLHLTLRRAGSHLVHSTIWCLRHLIELCFPGQYDLVGQLGS